MRKKAVITILSKQRDSKESGIEVVSPGEFYKADGCYYAVYDETELSGMEGTTTTLEISPENFLLTRVGTTTGDMKFARGSKEITMYNTPYGALELKIDTKDLEVAVDDNGGEVLINYDVMVAGQKPQGTTLKVNIKV